MCDRVGVLYAGGLVEEGPARVVFDDPRHPYTVGLLRSHPARRGAQGPRPGSRHDPGVPATARRRDRRAASSPIDARSPTTAAAARSRRSSTLGAGHASRCHYHDRAQTLPRASAPVATSRGRGRATIATRPCSPSRTSRRRSISRAIRSRALARRLHRRASGRDARPGRRVRERQDDARADPARHHGPRRGIERAARRRRARPARRASARRAQVRAVQIVFQNPDSALNRRSLGPPASSGARVTKLLHAHGARARRADPASWRARCGSTSG